MVGVWPVGLRDPLPTIPIPLANDDGDAMVDLSVPFDRVYDGAGYSRNVYQNESVQPLWPADAEWADGRVASIHG